jgi:hypothetical protein
MMIAGSLIQAAANVAWALCTKGRPAHLSLSLPECNTLGLGLLGGKDLDAAFHAGSLACFIASSRLCAAASDGFFSSARE